MGRPWSFRSATNLGLTLLGFAGVGYFANGIYNERNFLNPVVEETVKILGKNQKIKEMIGYPLSYQSSNRNRYNEKGNEMYFDFRVIGPRGKTNVEVTATKMKAKDVYEYDTQNESLKAAESKHLQLQKQLQQLQSNIQSQKQSSSKSWFGGSKKTVQKNQLQQPQPIQLKLKQVEQAKKTYQQLVNERKQRKNQYYIPQKQYYTQIVSQTGKDSQQFLPESATLYKLQNIACQLPNKSRINVLNNGQAYNSEDYQTTLDNHPNFSDLKKPLYATLHQKLSVNVAALSDQEIEQYSKHKTNFMYQKYNQYRMMAFICFMIGAGALFVYFSKNKVNSMSNSVMYQLVAYRVKSNPKISNFIRANKLKELSLDKTVGGGMKNNVFNCQIGINNVTMGRIEVQGKYNTKIGTYDYSRLVFKYIENNQHKQIDLLK